MACGTLGAGLVRELIRLFPVLNIEDRSVVVR